MSGTRSAIVIGGGVTGILSAWELLSAGWQVTLLEAQTVGAGSSSRTAAGIRQQFSTRATVLGMRYSVSFYERFKEIFEAAESPLKQHGYLFLTDSEEGWSQTQQRVQWQRSIGLEDVQVLDRAELAHRFPWIDTQVCVGASFCPSDGFLLPAVIYQEGARRVRELGGKLLQYAQVEGANIQGGRLLSLQTSKGEVSGDLFVNCTNAWSQQLMRQLGLPALPIAPLKRYLWFLQRGGSMTVEDFMTMPLVVSPAGVYCRPENEGSMLMGWAHAAEPEPWFSYDDQDQVKPGFSHNSGIDALPFEAWMSLAEALPPVGEFEGITATTCGYYGTTPDHNPFLGFDAQLGNVIHAVGFSGHGIMFGPFAARVVRQFAEGGSQENSIELQGKTISLDAFQLDRSFVASESMVI